MKIFSKGIVLRAIDYSDSSAIVKIFTHNHGLRSFMIRGVKGKRRKTGYIQPLSIIEIEYHLHERKELLVAGNIRFLESYQSISTHPHKRMVALFLAEVLSEVIKSDHIDEPLFEFIQSHLLLFDLEDWNPNFHLFFLTGMTKYLGFYPLLTPNPKCFDTHNGAFLDFIEHHPQVVTGPEVKLLYVLFTEDWQAARGLKLNRDMRNRITKMLMHYYQHHATGMRPVKSLQVLSEVLDD